MHIPPVHNRCALYFVIGEFQEKCTASQADSKAAALDRSRGANFNTPLYTKRAAVARTPPHPQTALFKEQP
jgi:hypothetical protein